MLFFSWRQHVRLCVVRVLPGALSSSQRTEESGRGCDGHQMWWAPNVMDTKEEKMCDGHSRRETRCGRESASDTPCPDRGGSMTGIGRSCTIFCSFTCCFLC